MTAQAIIDWYATVPEVVTRTDLATEVFDLLTDAHTISQRFHHTFVDVGVLTATLLLASILQAISMVVCVSVNRKYRTSTS